MLPAGMGSPEWIRMCSPHPWSRLEARVRELERLFGRKTMEVEILKEALDLARVKKPTLPSRSQLPEDTP
jgi:hypothetical protein